MAWKLATHGPHTDPAAWRRGLIVGFVAALHLGLLLSLLRPAAPLLRRLARAAPATDDIQVRLAAPPERLSPPPAPAVPTRHRRPTRAAPAHAAPASARSAAAPPRPLDLRLPDRMPDSGARAPLYIPGGRGFGQTDRRDARSRARLPGMWGARASHYRMRDPRLHGLAGALHLLQHALGATSRPCLRLEHLKTLGKRDLAARGLLPDDLPALAAKYGCR